MAGADAKIKSAEAAAATTGKSRMSAKEAFAKFDADNDGSLTFDEMVFAMRELGVTMNKEHLKVTRTTNAGIDFPAHVYIYRAARAQVVFDAYDSDKSATIDYPEFVLLMNTGCVRLKLRLGLVQLSRFAFCFRVAITWALTLRVVVNHPAMHVLYTTTHSPDIMDLQLIRP